MCQLLHEPRPSSFRLKLDNRSYKENDKGTIHTFSGCHSSKCYIKIWVLDLIH